MRSTLFALFLCVALSSCVYRNHKDFDGRGREISVTPEHREHRNREDSRRFFQDTRQPDDRRLYSNAD